MNREKIKSLLLTAGFAMATSLLLIGCEIDSSEESSRNVDIKVNGFYRFVDGKNNNALVSQNTGAAITSMDLRQNGDQLEGIDNNGNIFKGTIGNVVGLIASITLDGLTTAGEDGTITGEITVNDEAATDNAVMQGTWVEAALFATVYGIATVPTNQTSDGGSGTNAVLSIDPSVLIVDDTDSITFTASGGEDPYSFGVSKSDLGTFTQSDNVAIYTPVDAGGGVPEEGEQKITVTSGDGQSATATINQQSP